MLIRVPGFQVELSISNKGVENQVYNIILIFESVHLVLSKFTSCEQKALTQ